ncbi:MAG: arginine deiminase-related protein [Bacteroidota bacterium]
MIKPKAFGYNPETAEDNQFMAKADQFAMIIHQTASKEQDMLVKLLKSHNIEVILEEDTDLPKKPDAIFPNWVSFHNSGKVVLYPFKAPSRHAERRMDIIERLKTIHGFNYTEIVDYTHFEEQGKYLEGMGSMVLDRINKIAYACLSQRTSRELVEKFCADFGFKPVIFRAEHQVNGTAHTFFYTNIVMSLGDKFALVSFDLIPNPTEREEVRQSLIQSGKDIIEVSPEQTRCFLANAIQLRGTDGANYLLMSKKARNSMTPEQEEQIGSHAEIISADVNTIENYGGGSVGNMLAPIFLPKA